MVAKAPALEPDAPGSAPFRLGDQVLIGNRRQLRGTIRYCGPTAFAGGDWVGMELDVPRGRTTAPSRSVELLLPDALLGFSFVSVHGVPKLRGGDGHGGWSVATVLLFVVLQEAVVGFCVVGEMQGRAG